MTSATQSQELTLPADMPSLEMTRRHDRYAMASLVLGMVGSMAVLFVVASLPV